MAAAVLVEQLPALIGVMVGAGGSYAATMLNERSRWRRDRQVRWDERRLNAYMEYGDAVKRCYVLACRITAARGFQSPMLPLDPEAGIPELEEASAERARKWEAVLLLGDPATVKAAREWHQIIWHLQAYAYGRRADPAVWLRTNSESGAARDRFYGHARRSLDISGGKLPDISTPQWMAQSP
jgi:hypothetical protein